MVYFIIKVNLTKKQLDVLLLHFSSGTPLRLSLTPYQIDSVQGEDILVTQKQLTSLMNAKRSNRNGAITLSKPQILAMQDAMMSGEGILDSISSFFSNAKNYVSNKFGGSKNYTVTSNVTGKKGPTKSLSQMRAEMDADYKPPKFHPFGIEPKAPPKTNFDTIADKANNFSKSIYKFFDYGYN
jgi:hypothetical protein